MFYVYVFIHCDFKWTTALNTHNHRAKGSANQKVSLQYIINRVTDVPFSTFTEVLSEMAVKYPKLKFEVHFYLSDAKKDFAFKQGWTIMNNENKNQIVAFVTSYKNVIVRFRNLSEIMAPTPLRYIWEYMSLTYLTFYASVYEVWRCGGIAMDLDILVKNSLYARPLESRIENILQCFNEGREVQNSNIAYDDGPKVAASTNELKIKIFFFDIFEQLMNDTSGIFGFDHNTHKNPQKVIINTNEKPMEEINSEGDKKNVTNTQGTYTDGSNLNINLTNPSTEKVSTVISDMKEANNDSFKDIIGAFNASVIPQPSRLLFLFTNNFAAPKEKKDQNTRKHLYMMRDGSFVATMSIHNPFLGKILLTTGCPRLLPEYAIEKLYMEQCSTFALCETIHIF